MIPYYHFDEYTPSLESFAKSKGLQPSLWFSTGPMRDAKSWMYNHIKPDSADPYEQYRPYRDVQEIDPRKLFAAADEIIRRSGWEGPPPEYDGMLCPNYEDYVCMTHPNRAQNLTADQSFANHVRLIELMRGRYPYVQLANWGLPQDSPYWGIPSLRGYQMLGQLTQMYDYGCPSAYCKGRGTDLLTVTKRMNWAERWGKPLVVYLNPWERDRQGDNLWYPQAMGKFREVFQIVRATRNVVGVELWSMCGAEDVVKGRMCSEILSS